MIDLLVLDLDHTLVRCNTSYLFGRYLYRRGWFKTPALIKTLTAYASHRLFNLSLHTLHAICCRHIFQGHTLAAVKSEVDRFLSFHLSSILRPEIAALIQQFPRTVLLSASPDFLVTQIGGRLGVDESVGAEYSVCEGRIRGVSRVIDGQGKLAYVQAMGIPWEKIAFYTDSFLDLPLLRKVGQPVCVCPDRTLRKKALEFGWQVEDVDDTGKSRSSTEGRRAS